MYLARLGLTLICAGTLFGGEYRQEDRDYAIDLLEESRRHLVVMLEGLTQEQSEFRPDSTSWSILQVVEHLARAEEVFFDNVRKLVQGEPIPESKQLPDPTQVDQAILRQVPDRTHKVKAPPELVPRDEYRNRDEAFTAFSLRRTKTIEFIRDTKLNLRRYRGQSPVGELDAHQWILMIAAHTQRHLKQIEELTRHELFPKSQD